MKNYNIVVDWVGSSRVAGYVGDVYTTVPLSRSWVPSRRVRVGDVLAVCDRGYGDRCVFGFADDDGYFS